MPIIEGTVVGLSVKRLPGDRDPKPVWLWVSKPSPDSAAEVNHWWSMFIRRFDLKHTFQFLKQTLGWARPRLRDPGAADRWTWLILPRTLSCVWRGRWPLINGCPGSHPCP